MGGFSYVVVNFVIGTFGVCTVIWCHHLYFKEKCFGYDFFCISIVSCWMGGGEYYNGLLLGRGYYVYFLWDGRYYIYFLLGG